MRNINEIFDDRDIIIESMGFFNPMILEENNVVLTEGIVGGIVEKLRALFAMIKGWIDKLISFVSEKFNKLRGGRKKSGGGSDKSSGSPKEQITPATVKKAESDIAKEIANARKVVANNRNKRDIDECKKAISAVKSKMSQYNSLLKTKQEGVAKIKNASVGADSTSLKLPDLKNAKNAVNDLINDVKKVLKTDDPYAAFKGKSIKSYFMKSETEKEITIKEFLANKDYQSYNVEAGKDCIDQLRDYQKTVEATYQELEAAAKSLPQIDEDQAKYYAINKPKSPKADKLLNKAKSVNRVSQVVLKGGVAILSNYVAKIGTFSEKAGMLNDVGHGAVAAAEKDLADFRTNFIPKCRKELKALEDKLASLQKQA